MCLSTRTGAQRVWLIWGGGVRETSQRGRTPELDFEGHTGFVRWSAGKFLQRKRVVKVLDAFRKQRNVPCGQGRRGHRGAEDRENRLECTRI